MKTAAPEKKSVKTLKGQLFGAVSMMLVAAIALGTSTYAWFINNSTAAVDNMELTVSAAQSLQIAVKRNPDTTAGTGNPEYDSTKSMYTDYKSLVLKADIADPTLTGGVTGGAGWVKMFSTDPAYLMTPASVAATSLGTTTPKFYKSDNHISANSKLDSFMEVTGLGQGEVKVLPLSFLASSATSVYFGEAALTDIGGLITPVKSVLADPTAQATEQLIFDEQAKAIKAALRIAIVPGVASENKPASVTDPYTAGTPVLFQFDKGAPVFLGSGNNTDYSTVASYTKGWDEPNGKYDAIATLAAKTSENTYPVATIENTQVQVPDHTTSNANKYLATVTVSGNSSTVTATTAANTALFTLSGEVPRDVNVYIWLEGTDQDAVSAMSSYKFNLRLPFAATTPTT